MERLMPLTLILALAVPATAADDTDPEPPVSGARSLVGTWDVVKVIGMGVGPVPNGLSLTFTKDRMAVSNNNQPANKNHGYKVDDRKKPAHIDLVADNGAKTVQGIYKIEKDELSLCIGERTNRRPTDFAGKEESVLVLKRRKK